MLGVAGNLIGTDSRGTAALGNANRGVDIYNGAQRNRIGTKGDGIHDGAERNVISGNAWEGVGIDGAGTSNNAVAGNYVGVDISGAKPLPNLLRGVIIFSGASKNLIGGLSSADGNTIAFNKLTGVTVADATSIDNAILGNSIFSNTLQGIDLGNDGATPNDSIDADSGPNNFQNFPEISYATKSAGLLKVAYNVPSHPSQRTYPIRVEFFQADANGQGQTYLGADTFTTADYLARGKSVTFAATSSIKVFDKVVATATDSLADGGLANTSEFSTSAVVVSPWINARNRLDVNDDTHVAANNVVEVINHLNAFGPGPVPDNANNAAPYLDVNGDNNIAPNDALDVINAINAGQASEGEAPVPATSSQLPVAVSPAPVASDLLALLAADPAIQSPRRR
jgi:hypothetical protein